MNALVINDLCKEYKDFKLDHINLSLPSGCIMGLIGENGAGKSTTIKLILDMIKKDEGHIEILGKDNSVNIENLKQDIGVVLDEVGIPECLKANEINNIMKYAFINWNEDKYYQLLSSLNVPTNKEFKEFSRGMKMKMGMAIALSHNPKLLILDEATSGLDPLARDEVLNILNDFTREDEHSILISSHIVSDLEKLCDYIAFIHKGKLMLCEEKDVLLSSYGVIHCDEKLFDQIDKKAILHSRKTAYGIDAVVSRNAVRNIDVSPISIEDLFLNMVKENV